MRKTLNLSGREVEILKILLRDALFSIHKEWKKADFIEMPILDNILNIQNKLESENEVRKSKTTIKIISGREIKTIEDIINDYLYSQSWFTPI